MLPLYVLGLWVAIIFMVGIVAPIGGVYGLTIILRRPFKWFPAEDVVFSGFLWVLLLLFGSYWYLYLIYDYDYIEALIQYIPKIRRDLSG